MRSRLLVAAAATAAAAILVVIAVGAEGQRAHESAAVRLLLVGRFRAPTYLTAPPGDTRRRFVTERAGRIRVIRGRRILRRPFLDIRRRVSTAGEGGLLSMAFAPDYRRSRRFYVYFTDKTGAIRIEEYRRARSTPDRALPSSRRLVIRQRHFHLNHKGGQLAFGPDRMLYTAFGDGGGEGDPDRHAQDLGSLFGKLLRLDPRPGRRRGYRIPSGNPFARRAGARDEIYAYGLRNPYRFSFDRLKGHLTIGDVGAEAVEEIDFVRNRRGRGRAPRGGQNFGWSVFEGRRRFRAGTARGHDPPVIERRHSAGSCSIIGGYVIRDRGLGRRLFGRYVYGDLCDSRVRSARLRHPRASADRPLGVRVGTLVSFGEDARGRIYAISLDGPVYRLARAG